VVDLIRELFCAMAFAVRFRDGSKCPPLPFLRKALNDLDVFVAGEAESDEPFAVKHPRRFLLQRDAPPVVLDQVVVGGKDVGDSLLNIETRNRNAITRQVLNRDLSLSGTRI